MCLCCPLGFQKHFSSVGIAAMQSRAQVGLQVEGEADLWRLPWVWVSTQPAGHSPLPFLNGHVLTEMESQRKIAHPCEGTFGAPCMPLPFTVVFIFLSWTLLPGFSTEAVKEDGEPSYLRMITIVNIHGWFTYHSWLHRHGSRSEASAGVARWYILHCATMDLCIL